MHMMVPVEDFVARFPRPLAPGEKARAETLLGDAEDLVREAFAREGRDLDAELGRVAWLPSAVKRVIREMVSAVVLIGTDAGKRQTSVTAGAVSESVTWADVSASRWGELVLTDAMRDVLGLAASAQPRGTFPAAPRWPESPVR